MSEAATLLITAGIEGWSDPEKFLNRGLESNTLDILEKTGSIPGLERRILVTNSRRLSNLDVSRYPGLEIEKSGKDFHFGKKLFDVIKRYDVRNMFYVGGGSGVLFGKDDFTSIVDFLRENDDLSIANNFYSADMIGFSPANSILNLSPPNTDNRLGWLTRDAGLQPFEMKRGAKTELDLDSPVDMLPLKLSEIEPGKLNDYLTSLDWGNTRIKEVLPQFTDENSRLVVAGRIGAATWSYLERNAACHVDVISEGRGSYGEQGTNVNGSYILGKLFEKNDPRSFIETLLDKGTSLFLDTRVLFDFFGNWPCRKDRFSSDLLKPEAIDTSYLKKLTRAAIEASKPVVLGGHSMISGSLYLLADVAWNLVEPKSVNIRPKTMTEDNTN
ncbi:hypothetical protein K9M06_03995 [Candidatus Bipolaricaulota bacterium]|nr:hypothetical protein [Candidatus Bipolaricaulota bacterium]